MHPNTLHIALALFMFATSAANAQSLEQRAVLAEVGVDQQPGGEVQLQLHFRDAQGNEVRLQDLITGDRPVLLNLVYYRCPRLCNMSMNGLVRALRTVSLKPGEDFTIITVSFDEQETPPLAAAAKRTALKRYGNDAAAMHWHFLTGERDQIKQLADAVGFRYRWDPTRGQYAHAACLIVLTPEAKISRYLLGVEYAPRDLRLALVESGDGEISTISDQILLLCYQYDPATGKYGLLIHQVLRVAGVLTVLVMGGGIGLLLQRERKRRHAGEQQIEKSASTLPEAKEDA